MNRPLRFFLCLAAAAAALTLAGCYYDRFTGRYDEIPELEGQRSAILEQSDSSEAEENRIRILEKLEKENEDIYNIDAGDKIAISF